MKTAKRIFSTVLALLLLVAALPITAAEVSAVRADGYMTFNEAIPKMRQQMVNRHSDYIEYKVYIEDTRVLGEMELRTLFEDAIYQHTGKPNEGDTLRYECTSFGFYVADRRSEGNKHWLTIMFAPHSRQSVERIKTLDNKVKTIISSLKLNGKSEYDKILAIYTYVCKNVDYDLEYEKVPQGTQEYEDLYSAYGALVNNKAVCQGFSLAMYRLLLEAGIENHMIGDNDHIWNAVKLDGKYYCLDATWDYGYEPEHFNWFLKGSANFLDTHHSSIPDLPISPIDYGAPATATASGSCGDNATWALTADGTLAISGSGAIMNTSTDVSLWTDVNMYIKKVVIQQGITAIGDYAFWNCPQLTSVSIPSSVKTIGAHAFDHCISLKEITIPNSVTSVGESAFAGCVSMEKAVLSSSMSKIENNTFINCISLKSINIPSSIKTIGSCAFSSAFDPNANFSLTIPATVTSVGWRCFAWTGIKSAVWNAKTELLDTDMFYMSENLETVTLNDSIKRFGTEVFAFCYALKTVKMPSGLLEMEDYYQGVFDSCYALESITLPKTLTKITPRLFYECMSLKQIELHEGITEIGTNAFGCSGIENIIIPTTVKSIGGYAFVSPYLKSVTFLGDAPNSYSADRTFDTNLHPVTIIYPGSNPTWTSNVIQALSTDANLKWVASHGAEGPHTMGDTWLYDANSHWKQCVGCDSRGQEGAHSYTNSCDESCNTCGYLRSVVHTYEWGHNANQHWCACKCGAQSVAPEGHSYNGMGICTDCGAQKGNTSTEEPPTAPPTEPPKQEQDSTQPDNTQPTAPNATDPAPTEPDTQPGSDPDATEPTEDPDETPADDFPWLIVVIAGVVIVGCVAAAIVIKKKN